MRSGHDEWDIVTGVGYTALVVAGWRALHTRTPRPVVTDPYAQDFVTAAADPYLTGLLERPDTAANAAVFPRLYGVQTRFFDEFFTTAGSAQAVILAAGLDSRAYRLAWPAGTAVFEVDRRQVLAFKDRVLAARDATPTCRRVPVAADLRDDWSVPLTAAGFDPARPAAWSVEGLLPYLTGPAQDALFTRIGQLSAPGSRLAVGAVGSGSDWGGLAALEARYPGLRTAGEVDFAALTYPADSRAEPAAWLPAHGWTVDQVATSPQLQTRFGRVPAEVDVEVDRVLHSHYLIATRRAG